MAQLGNTLTTYIGTDPTPVVTNRESGESNQDFARRHGRAILARLQSQGVGALSNVETGAKLGPLQGQTLEEFVADFVDLLLEVP